MAQQQRSAKEIAEDLTRLAEEVRVYESGYADQLIAMAKHLATPPAEPTNSLDGLASDIETYLAPDGGFYSFNDAADWCDEADPIVNFLLIEAESRPSRKILHLIERALYLVDQTTEVSDSSSGDHDLMLEQLSEAHLKTVHALQPPLDIEEQCGLARWLYHLCHGAKSTGFIKLTVTDYADVLGEKAINEFAKLLRQPESRNISSDAYSKLAVAQKDRKAIIAAYNEQSLTFPTIASLVHDLAAIGDYATALDYGERAFHQITTNYRIEELAVAIANALDQCGTAQDIYLLHKRVFERYPSTTQLDNLIAAANALTGDEAIAAQKFVTTKAERKTAKLDAGRYISWLMLHQRDDDAWEVAKKNPRAAKYSWESLCLQRAVNQPADAVEMFPQVIDEVLLTAKNSNYAHATQLLLQMRDAAKRAGDEHFTAYNEYLQQLLNKHKRRTNLLEMFKQSRLI